MAELDLLLEAERRGILPPGKVALLEEARRRGLVPSSPDAISNAPQTAQPPSVPSQAQSLARAPAEFLDPYTGGLASWVLPTTPAGWGAAAGLAAAAPFTAGTSLAPWAARAGMAGIGGAVGSLIGGSTPQQAATEGALMGGMQGVAEKVIGGPVSHAVKQIKGIANPIVERYGKALATIIPGIKQKTQDSTWFFKVVRGEGKEALDKAYQSGINEIKEQVGEDTILASPQITKIVRKYLPKAFSDISKHAEDVPAHRVLGKLSVENAIKAAQEIGARARLASKSPEGAILGREMRQANAALREAIEAELNAIKPGAGDIYRGINSAFRRGRSVLDVLEDRADRIFVQGTRKVKIDEAELAQAMNDSYELLRNLDATDLQSAASRGAPPGAGARDVSIPLSGYIFPGGGLGGRLHEGIQLPVFPGQASPAIPLGAGYGGQRLVDILIGPEQELK